MSDAATFRPHWRCYIDIMATTFDSFVAKTKKKFHRDSLPKSRPARIAIGALLVGGGILGFLPILGFWMVPVGLAILAIDVPIVRKFVRKVKRAYGRWRKRVKPRKK